MDKWGRHAFASLLAMAIPVVGSSSAAADDACLARLFQKHASADGKIGLAELKALQRDPRYRECEADIRAAGTPLAATGAGAPPKPKVEEPTRNFSRVTPILRSDFSEVWLFKNPPPAADASGAQISVTGDRVAHNTKWIVHGTGAVVYQYFGDYGPNDGAGVIGVSLAPYVSIDYLRNSNPGAVKNNADTVTFGGFAEVGLDALGGQHYLRFRGAAVSDRIANTDTGSFVFEWIPIYDRLGIGTPRGLFGLPFIYRFNPELEVRRDTIFNRAGTAKVDSTRVGPQLSAVYKLVAPEDDSFLNRIRGRTTFSWLQDTDSGEHYTWFETALTYNIDSEGHIGLTGSYKKGRKEDTGARTDLWTLGLTAKW